MMDDNLYQNMKQTIRSSTSLDELLKLWKDIEAFRISSNGSHPTVYDLLEDIFQSMREVTLHDIKHAESVIVDYLLPYLEQDADDSNDFQSDQAIRGMRECLVEWLNQYPATERFVLRNQVLDKLLERLKEMPSTSICWTISQIGFRRKDVVDQLWIVAEQEGNITGDTALSTLTSLGVPFKDRRKLLDALHQRASLRRNLPLISALRRLADPLSLNKVQMYWLPPRNTDGTLAQSFAFRVFPDVADATQTDEKMQNRVWQIISDYLTHYPNVFFPDVYGGGDVVSHCDSTNVVPDMLRWLSTESEQTENLIHRRTLLYHRLEECVRPRQLIGWEDTVSSSVVDVLHRDACEDTRNEGRWTTQEMMAKRFAWDMLFRLGNTDALTWFEEGVATETNGYLRRQLSDLFACFRLDPLPSSIIKWIIEPFDASSSEDSVKLVSTMGAIEVARSAGSVEAFEALCKCGLTYKGQNLQAAVDALAGVAVVLARAGNSSIADTLVDTAMHSSESRYRTAAARGLESLAAADLLPIRFGPQLIDLVLDEERDPLERSMLVSALGYLSTEELPPHVCSWLNTWVRERRDWLGQRSLETLTRKDFLIAHPQLLTEYLELYQKGEKWDVPSTATLSTWQAYIIGLHYRRYPDNFSPAIATLLTTQNWAVADQVLWLLNTAGGGQTPLPREIEDALLQRARQQQTQTGAELGIFQILALLMPDKFAEEPWNQLWNDWLPAACGALADALGKAIYTRPEARANAVSLLHVLMYDGQFTVRRSAYRALSHLAPESLSVLCKRWSKALSVELRQRAAEAYGWLSTDGDQPEMVESSYKALATDEEPSVREMASRAWQERREREWAAKYLSYIQAVDTEINDDLLKAWRYGQAIKQIGDDTCIQNLRNILMRDKLPSHIRFWLQQIVKETDERWRKVTSEWPKPWMEGAIEEGIGSLVLTNGQELSGQYSVWQQPGTQPLQPDEWGGMFLLEKEIIQQEIIEQSGEFTLQLEDGRQGTALCRASTSSTIAFAGTGTYPTKAE